jgi:hypothetical protein
MVENIDFLNRTGVIIEFGFGVILKFLWVGLLTVRPDGA